MATYVNNLRLKEIATGDEDGTWGTSTNTNLELITDGFSYGTLDVAADANETFTMPDATANATRGLYIKFTSTFGSLTATRTLTLGPNTVSKMWFIENATSGSQSIVISQGSGASVTIANGTTKVIYADGTGAGAAVVDALALYTPVTNDTLAEVLALGNTSGANNLIIDSGQALTTNTINETTAASGVTIDSVLLKDNTVTATTYSGALASTVTATTQAASDNSTKVATTAYVDTSSAAHDSLAEVLAVGNTTSGTDVSITSGDSIVGAGDINITGTAATGALTVTGNSSITGTLDVSGDTIIGSTSVTPDGTLHVYSGSAGSVTPSTAADDLVIEHSTSGGMSILVPDAETSTYRLGSPSDGTGMLVSWNYSGSAGRLSTRVAGAELALKADNNVTNLTLSGASGSELATFAGGATFAGDVRIGAVSTTITGLTERNLVVGSSTGGEIVAYRVDNAGVAGDFVGAFLFGNDDNATTEDHFAGMWGKISNSSGSADLHWAAGKSNYETDTPQMTLSAAGDLTLTGDVTLSADKLLTISATSGDSTSGLWLYDGGGSALKLYQHSTDAYTIGIGSNTNIQLDNSGNATFAGDVTLSAGDLTVSGGFMNYGGGDSVTIAAGAVTVTETNTVIAGEGAASDTLNTINGGSSGDLLIISTASNGQNLTVVDDGGNIRLNGTNCELFNVTDKLVLIASGSNWHELSRSINGTP